MIYLIMVLKIIAWNINGIRSMNKKDDLFNLIETQKPNIICFGETKISCPFIEIEEDLKKKLKVINIDIGVLV